MTDPSSIEIPDFLDVAARSRPSHAALWYGDAQWTFAELQDASATAARFLTAASIELTRGTRIGILSANRPGVVFAIHAAARIDSPFVPFNWRQTATELAWQIDDAGIVLLLTDEDRLETARAACSRLPVTVVSIADLEQAAKHGQAAESAPPIALDREAVVIYTSGTTGKPKGARLTYGNLWFSAVASALHSGHQEDDRWLLALPLFHIGGLSIVYRGAIGAIPIVLLNGFELNSALSAIDRGVSLVSLVPTMLRRLIDHRPAGPWPNSLRSILIGGGPTPPELVERSSAIGLPIAPTYGLTEAASQVATMRPAELRSKVGSSGLPLPTTQMRIVEHGEVVGTRQIGEIELCGPTLFSGYVGQEAGAPCDDRGWFATGDAGYLDDDGYLFVVDRRDDVIISGGENVYPAEIERVLSDHPQILDAGVVSLREESWGDRPVAVVVWDGDPVLAESTLRAYCRSRLAAYKVPDRIYVVSEIPRSPSGKLLRRKLRETVQGAGL